MERENFAKAIQDKVITTGVQPVEVSNANLENIALQKQKEEYWQRIPEYQRASKLLYKRWCAVWDKLSEYFKQEEMQTVGEAFVFAANSHGRQMRYSGDPYIIHPLTIALILAGMTMDCEAITAALLHDVLEDTPVEPQAISDKFGNAVLTLVDGVTKLGKLPFKTVEDYESENLRKMFVVMAKDIRVVLIKLADRLHNMRTISAHRREKQLEIAKETMEIYAPLAHRLGIYQVKRELEDLSFKVLDPEMFEEIKQRVRKKLPEREHIISEALDILSERLTQEKISATLKGRPKHFYSIYEKMQRKKLSMEELYDLLALRVIVQTIAECYQVLGIVHTMWKPIPGQFDDYIANPKRNLYRSLHTTIVGPTGEPLEIQIRTWEMHYLAEYGVAAHWNYKEGNTKIDVMDEQLTWIRRTLEEAKISDETNDSNFLDTLKTDVLSAQVFVFSPKGKVISVPTGSTPIDFAYSIHTEIGHKCIGAKVNGKIVPMDYELKNGDIVSIMTSPSAKPSRDWLKLAKATRTRTKIKQWFRQVDRQEREEKIKRGKELLEKEALRRDPKENQPLEKLAAKLSQVVRDMGLSNVEDLYVSVGSGNVSPSGVFSRIKSNADKSKDKEEKNIQTQAVLPKEAESEIIVDGARGVFVSLAQCCKPIPGDNIIGYMSQLHGITVHRKDCANITEKDSEKLVDVAWGRQKNKTYVARLRIEGVDKNNLVGDLVQCVTNHGASLASIQASVVNNSRMRITMEIRVKNLEQLYEIIGKMNSVGGIIEIIRG